MPLTLELCVYIVYVLWYVQVVITIFWLGKLTRGKFSGPELDLAAFSNLVDAPMTPLSRSEYSSPSGSIVYLPQEPPEPSEDGFFRYRGGSGGATSPWNLQHESIPIRYDSLDRAGGYGQPARVEVVPMRTVDAASPVMDAKYPSGRLQRPDTLKDTNRPFAAPNTVDRPTTMVARTAPPAAQRQVSPPTVAGPVFSSGVSVVRPTPAATADPLRYVKTDMSPLAEEARQTIDQLQRQKQQTTQWEPEQNTDNWQAV